MKKQKLLDWIRKHERKVPAEDLNSYVNVIETKKLMEFIDSQQEYMGVI